MKTIKQIYKIKAPIEKVWDALTNPKTIDKWGGGPAKMNDKIGSDFSLWGGDIWGMNTKVIENKLLVQNWYGGKWDKPSNVTFELNESSGVTTVKLTHTDLPEGEEDNFEEGWKDYYIGPLKEFLERN